MEEGQRRLFNRPLFSETENYDIAEKKKDAGQPCAAVERTTRVTNHNESSKKKTQCGAAHPATEVRLEKTRISTSKKEGGRRDAEKRL